MNFEFLKDLRGLQYVYENCSNAEMLVNEMPDLSMTASRKSAEMIAKMVYLAAHSNEMENLSFKDILSDYSFKRFINNRDVMDAFHYIRKSGNSAVHGEGGETSEDAISVLQDLHYVAGETARRLGLLKTYPEFNDNVGRFPSVKYIEEDVNKKANEMFLSYVEEFNAQKEREQFLTMDEYDFLTYAVEGVVEMHEYLEFKYRPKQTAVIEFIQQYISKLLALSDERSPEKAKDLGITDPVVFSATIILDDTREYRSSDYESFLYAVVNLSSAKSFSVDIKCEGSLQEFYHDFLNENGCLNMIRKDEPWTGAGMLDKMEEYKRRERFTYKLALFYPNSGEFKHEKIEAGKTIDLLSVSTNEIINVTNNTNKEWWSWNLDLVVDFDFQRHSAILSQLQDITRKMIPPDQIRYCEQSWADGDNQILCSSVQWNPKSLKVVQDYLDAINAVILPIKDEIDADAMGCWEIKDDFAVATWVWTDEGFKIIGTYY